MKFYESDVEDGERFAIMRAALYWSEQMWLSIGSPPSPTLYCQGALWSTFDTFSTFSTFSAEKRSKTQKRQSAPDSGLHSLCYNRLHLTAKKNCLQLRWLTMGDKCEVWSILGRSGCSSNLVQLSICSLGKCVQSTLLWAAAILTGSRCIWWPPTPLIPNPVQPIHYSRHIRHQIVSSRRKGPWKVGCKRPVDKGQWRKVCAKYEQDCECGDMDIKLVRFPNCQATGVWTKTIL